jgi:hypothetical protein
MSKIKFTKIIYFQIIVSFLLQLKERKTQTQRKVNS